MFRALMFIGVLGAVAFMAGWFTIDRTEEETTIRFNRDEIRADTSKAFAKGRDLINQGREAAAAEEQQIFGQGQSQDGPTFPGAPFSNYQQPAPNAGQFGTPNYGGDPNYAAPVYGGQPPAGYQAPNGYAAPQQATLPGQSYNNAVPSNQRY